MSRYLIFSQAFYQRDASIKDVLRALEGSNFLDSDQERLISKAASVELFNRFTKAKLPEQRDYLARNGKDIILVLFDVLDILANDKSNNVKFVYMYVLGTIDGILFDDRANLNIFREILQSQVGKEGGILTFLHNTFVKPDYDIVVYQATARILSVLYTEIDAKLFRKERENFMGILLAKALNQNKRKDVSEFCIMSCLAHFLKHEDLINIFLKSGGINIITRNFQTNSLSNDLQVMYYTILCLWLLSYDKVSVPYFTHPEHQIVPSVIEVIQKISREKILRVACSLFRNLSEYEVAVEVMVDNGLLKVVDVLLRGSIKDTELKEDLEYLGQLLEKNIKILTSFEKYIKELNSGMLEWGPVHSERFWKDNVKKFEENNFQNVGAIVKLLDGYSEKTVAIACYDIGEFCRFHPFGKNVLDNFRGKEKIMDLINSDKQEIRENAVLALQKIMLQNWQSVA